MQLEQGENRFEIGFRLPDVRVWSTWDRGEQPLYELVLSCEGAEERHVSAPVRWSSGTGRSTSTVSVSSCAGSTTCPPTRTLPGQPRELLRADASLVREAGMNAVRVHAHVADSAFYEACDELGLLVLQDFPLQWTHRRSILGPAVTQAGEMARTLRGYPSVGIYLAHDEPFFVAPPEKWSSSGFCAPPLRCSPRDGCSGSGGSSTLR